MPTSPFKKSSSSSSTISCGSNEKIVRQNTSNGVNAPKDDCPIPLVLAKKGRHSPLERCGLTVHGEPSSFFFALLFSSVKSQLFGPVSYPAVLKGKAVPGERARILHTKQVLYPLCVIFHSPSGKCFETQIIRAAELRWDQTRG